MPAALSDGDRDAKQRGRQRETSVVTGERMKKALEEQGLTRRGAARIRTGDGGFAVPLKGPQAYPKMFQSRIP